MSILWCMFASSVCASRFGEDPLLLVERAAAPLLGIKCYGVHMNGYVRKEDSIYLWVATRSASKPTWPSQLDHIAAGGQVLLISSSSFLSLDAHPVGMCS
jgi:hypothetical protein